MAYTIEHLMILQDELRKMGLGKLTVTSLLRFDIAVRDQVRHLRRDGVIQNLN